MAANTKKKKSRRRKKKSFLRSFLPYFFIILVAAALIAGVIFITSRRSMGDNRKPSAVELNQTSSLTDENSNRLRKNSNEEIAKLLERYFQAKKSADLEEMNKIAITGSDTAFNEASMKAEAQYTESYSNISYYVTDGIVDNTYIVFVCYDEKYIGIDTKAPAMRRLYMTRDDEGTLVINLDSKSWSDEVNTYMQEVSDWAEVKELANDVNTRLQEACQNDSKLDDLVKMLNGELPAQTAEAQSLEEVQAEDVQQETVLE